MLYPVYTDYNTNLVSKRVLDRSLRHILNQQLECETHGQMADDARLLFHKVVQVPIRVSNVKLEEIFVVSQIN